MAEILRRRNIILAMTAAVALTGCNEPGGQIGSSVLVNCDGQPKQNQQVIDLPAGSTVDLSNHVNPYYSDVKLHSQGSGNIGIEYEATDYDKSVKPQTEPDGSIVFNGAANVHYSIKGSEGANGTTHLVIDLSCNNPQ